MFKNESFSKKIWQTVAASTLGVGLVFGTTSCSLFVDPNISQVNLNLSEEKQLESILKASTLAIAKDGGIYSVIQDTYTMNIAYNSLYYPYDIVFYSDGRVINAGSSTDEGFNSNPLGTLSNTLFDFGVYEFSREGNVYTAKETDGVGVMKFTIKNNLLDSIYSKDGETIYDIRISYKMTDEAIEIFERINKEALTADPVPNTDIPDTNIPQGSEIPDFGAENAEELPTPKQ